MCLAWDERGDEWGVLTRSVMRKRWMEWGSDGCHSILLLTDMGGWIWELVATDIEVWIGCA